MTKDRRLTKDELSLWQRVTADIERLTKKAPTPVKPKPRPEKPAEAWATSNPGHPTRTRQAASPATPTSMPALDPNRPVNTDRRTWEKLRRGQVPIESRLDLHGRTQSEAHAALDQFLAASVVSGFRCILIVTGKGVDGHGVLRQMIPRWLSERNNREKIITYCTAQPRHGGAGALYVLLRRPRSRGRR